MLNKSHDHHIEIHNYSTASPAYEQRYDNSNLAAVCIVTIIAAVVIGVVRSVQSVLVHLIDALATVASSLIAILPWLAGVAVVAVLVYWFLRSLPEAIDEVAEIRYRRMIARQQVLLLEQKNASYITVDSVAARIEAE